MYVFGRAVDYHERNPWAAIWVGMSPQNEVFVFKEKAYAVNKWVNRTIAEDIARSSGRLLYSLNLIDPLASKIQTNTGRSVIADLNEDFYKLRAKGIGSGGYWEPYDTKGTVGRDNIRMRLRHSVECVRPFNNLQPKDPRDPHSREVYLPTIWIFRNCKMTANSLKQWRYEEWESGKVMVNKDRKETPAQKFSHFCTALEGILKDSRFTPRRNTSVPRRRNTYFKER